MKGLVHVPGGSSHAMLSISANTDSIHIILLTLFESSRPCLSLVMVPNMVGCKNNFKRKEEKKCFNIGIYNQCV